MATRDSLIVLNWGITFGHVYNDEPPSKPGGRIPIECRHCFTHADAEVVSVFVTPHNNWHQPPADMNIHNVFLRCTRCRGALLLLWPYGKDHSGAKSTFRILFLIGSVRGIDPTFQKAVPPAIVEDLRQADTCAAVGATYGAALLYRRAVQ